MFGKLFFVRKFISVVLIVVFAIGITPVVFLHNIFANHTDVSYHNANVKGIAISKAGINCHCISFVAEAHFTSTASPISLLSPVVGRKPDNDFYKDEYRSQQTYFSDLRGPPSIG